MNEAFQYQRLILGYHGCDKGVAEEVLKGEASLEESDNSYDWLGTGIYFWEHGPERALEWAEYRKKAGKIKQPSVIGAVIHLGRCFDLMDRKATKMLSKAFIGFEKAMEGSGYEIPGNEPVSVNDNDSILRKLDCSVLNWAMKSFDDSNEEGSFDSVRGLFQEAELAYEGSAIRMKSHIQIAVRNQACILGYFKPV